jgi:hypothetical protein
MWDWKYMGVRELRMSLAVAKLEPKSNMGILITDGIRKWIEAIQPVKSTEIRKTVKLALSQSIRPLRVTHDREEWVYEGDLQGKAISVAINYAHRYHQLDYRVLIPNQRCYIPFGGLSYERLMGLVFAHWDCLEQANLDQSIALLKDLITHCAGILHRMPEVHEHETST